MDASNSPIPRHNSFGDSPLAPESEIPSTPGASQCSGAKAPDTVCSGTLAKSPGASTEKSEASGALDSPTTVDPKLLDLSSQPADSHKIPSTYPHNKYFEKRAINYTPNCTDDKHAKPDNTTYYWPVRGSGSGAF